MRVTRASIHGFSYGPRTMQRCQVSCSFTGVINVLPGDGKVCGQAILEHPDIAKIGFTGSTPIGQHIMRTCSGPHLKRVSLELGGKSPLIIFADCDLDKAVRNVSWMLQSKDRLLVPPSLPVNLAVQ